jgi:hypothetical protein
MSQINVNTITGKDGGSAVNFPHGITVTGVVTATTLNQNVSGIVTATSFSGPLTGDVTGNVTGNCSGTAGGLTGTPNITVGTVTGTDATFSGNLTVQGTTTTIDTAVTDVDSLAVDGNVNVGSGLSAYGFKVESGFISNLGASGTVNTDLDNGHIHKYQGATSGNYGPNFRKNSSTTLNSIMAVGDVVSVVFMAASTSHYLDQTDIQVDGSTSNLDIDFIGGAAPTAANGSGFDIYTFTIQKTAATPAYHIIVNATSAA